MELRCWNRIPGTPTDATMKIANVPMRKWRVSINKIPGEPAFLVPIQAYVENLKRNLVCGDGLLLWGPYRSGKSSIAACVLREVAAHQLRPYWLLASELADAWEEQDHRADHWRTAPLMVLDDLGTEGDHEFRRDMIRRALRLRLEDAGATIVTTNMDQNTLRRHYGDKLLALLRECLLPVQVEGVDWLKMKEKGEVNG